MALIFSSGGGRLGNQLLNLIHLIALSIEYKVDIFKLNDSFLTSKEQSIFFNVYSKNLYWKINKNSSEKSFFSRLIFKIIIRFLHLYFYISPFNKSYKIGAKNNYPSFILAKNLKYDFSINNLIKESNYSNVVISGWGLREWELVKKHKKEIVLYINKGIENLITRTSCHNKEYLLVHIRKSDFLEIKAYKDLNFNNQIWIKSISKLCKKKFIKDVVIFSDSVISIDMVADLRNKDLNVFIPDSKDKSIFLELFFNYVKHASLIICNSSSLVLSVSFLFHENIYLPSQKKDYQKVCINNAHNSFPTFLNWN